MRVSSSPAVSPEASPTISYLHLTLHLVNGRSEALVQTEPDKAQHILGQMRPDRLYTQKHLLFYGPDAVTVLPTESIERITVRSDALPHWPHNDAVALVEEITEEDFAHIRRREPARPPKTGGTVLLPRPAEVGVAAEMRSGATVFLRVHPERAEAGSERAEITSADTYGFLTHIFTRPVLFGHTEDGAGIFLLNPANVLRFTLSPAPPTEIAGAWPMTATTQSV